MGQEDLSYYDVLGVDRGIDADGLRRAYLHQARRHHPDAGGGDSERMLRLNEAWAVLGDPQRRARYDDALRACSPRARVTRLDTGGFVPLDDDEEDDELAAWRDGDDVGDPRTTPRRAVVLAPLVGIAVTIVAGVMWVMTGRREAVAVAVVAGALSLVGFLVAPLIALALASRYEPRR